VLPHSAVRGTQMSDYLELPIGKEHPEIITAVIEIPKDSSNKYEYDKRLHVFRLDRNLHSPVHYPADYGFVPQTLAEDGDPLDILVLGEQATFPGCIYYARPIGMFEMLDQGINDQKIVAYAVGNPRYSEVRSYMEVSPHVRLEIEHFFSVYKDLEGKRTKALGWKDLDDAHRMIASCHDRFLQEHVMTEGGTAVK
jgi:inorganic pyrophosphatase